MPHPSLPYHALGAPPLVAIPTCSAVAAILAYPRCSPLCLRVLPSVTIHRHPRHLPLCSSISASVAILTHPYRSPLCSNALPFATVLVCLAVRRRARMPCFHHCACVAHRSSPHSHALQFNTVLCPASPQLACVAPHPLLVQRRPCDPVVTGVATLLTRRRGGSAAERKVGQRELARLQSTLMWLVTVWRSSPVAVCTRWGYMRQSWA
ncbi:hypothetical protein BD779DRAFT_1570273 [Infundibulicybe gibba]|nr:hypothetical protein BD779DRAFT_1574402 [Infundibulicybe gibba]KAF8873357.1 hypothetical protein BD779DRAFT_1570273 [Infundibulicybe gibba]